LTFVDTNILIDIASGNPEWAGWSRQALIGAHAKGKVLFNAVVYAEFAISFETQAECDAEIDKFDLTFVEIPKWRPFAPRKRSALTVAPAAPEPSYCRTSSSAPTRACCASRS
jgi:predicted nucleic acid-binding protein